MTTSETPAAAPSYRFMLALVIILGVLIVIGVIGLVLGALLGGRHASEPAAFAASIDAPGAHIAGASLQGNRILLTLSGGAAGDELVMLDAASGKVVGRIGIHVKP